MQVPNNQARVPIEHYSKLFGRLDPAEVTSRTGTAFHEQVFLVRLLGVSHAVSWPDFRCETLGSYAQILVLRYLIEGRLTPSTQRFVAYRDLPWGGVYDTNFQGRCVGKLARQLGGNREYFKSRVAAMGATPLAAGDSACEIEFMPGLNMRFILWFADDEFAASAQILFSDNFADAFTAEDLAVVGDLAIAALKGE